jgi:uncharacterized caspase-like protein
MTERDVSVLRSPSSVPRTDYRAKYCLSIGIDQYIAFPRLNHAAHDARGIATLLGKRYGFEVDAILNQDATHTRIRQTIETDLPCKVQSDDLIVIFFAGHGHTMTLPSGEQRGFIVPVDARLRNPADLLSVNQVCQSLDYLPSRHILLLFDSCFSGMLTVRAGPADSSAAAAHRAARWAITSGGADETVLDGGWNNHSMFTGLLLQALQEDKAAVAGATTVVSLFTHLAHEVPKLAKQTPAFGALPGHQGGDIWLVPQGTKSAVVPISIEPPPSISRYSADFPQEGHTTRSSVDPGDTDSLLAACRRRSEAAVADVPIFASSGRQYAIIIGTTPAAVAPGLADSGGVIPTEFLDACDALDWFLNPDVFGGVPPDQLFFLADADATEDRVKNAMDTVHLGATDEDSVLFYFSGHATSFLHPGELMLYDAFKGEQWGTITTSTRGILPATLVVDWMNRLRVAKAVAILDTGGPAMFRAGEHLAANRYVLSSLRGSTLSRNGFVTWYVRRALQKLGPNVTLRLLYEILRQADDAFGRRQFVYLHGAPGDDARTSAR